MINEENIEIDDLEVETKKDKRNIVIVVIIIILFLLLSTIAGVIRSRHTDLIIGKDKSSLEEFVQDVYTDKINEKIGGDSDLTFDEITTIIANLVSQELSKTNLFTGSQLKEMQNLIDERIYAAGPVADPQVAKEITTIVEKQYETNYSDMTELHEQMRILLAASEEVSGDRYDQLKKADEEVTAWLKEAQKGLDENFKEREASLENQEKQLEARMSELDKAIDDYNTKSSELSEKLKKLDETIAKAEEAASKTPVAKPDTNNNSSNSGNNSNAGAGTEYASTENMQALEDRIEKMENVLGKAEDLVNNTVEYSTIERINGTLDEINDSVANYSKESVENISDLIDDLDKRIKELENYKEQLAETPATTYDDSALQNTINEINKVVNGTPAKDGNPGTPSLQKQIDELNTLVKTKSDSDTIAQQIKTIQDTLNKLGDTYAAKGDYLTKEKADGLYASKGDYLTSSDAADTYVTKSDATNTYGQKKDVESNTNNIEILKKYMKIADYDASKTDYKAGDMVIKDGQVVIAVQDGDTIKWEVADYSTISQKISDMTADLSKIEDAIYGNGYTDKNKKQRDSLQAQIDSLQNSYDALNTLIQGDTNVNNILNRITAIENSLKIDGKTVSLETINKDVKDALKGIDGIQAYMNVQKYVSTDASGNSIVYKEGDIVVFDNEYYRSKIDNNTEFVENTDAWEKTSLNDRLDANANKTLSEVTKLSTTIAEKLGYGNYDESTSYSKDAYVIFGDTIYVSLTDGNKGNTPSTSSEWQATSIAKIIETHVNKINELSEKTIVLDQKTVEDALGLKKDDIATKSDLDGYVKSDDLNGYVKAPTSGTYINSNEINNYISEYKSTLGNTQKEKYNYKVEDYTENGSTQHRLIISENKDTTSTTETGTRTGN